MTGVWIAVGIAFFALALVALRGLHPDRFLVTRRWVQDHVWNWIYDRLAPVYDVVVEELTLHTTHRFRLRALPHLPSEGARILEVGVGGGRLHTELADSYAMAGIDRAMGMVRLTRRRLEEAEQRSGLCVADVTALPWASDTFDAVVSTFVLSAVPDLERAMDEMVRVVRAEGGRVIVVDAGEASDGNWVAHLLAQTWRALGDYIRDERPLMTERRLDVQREEFGPCNCVHVTVGTRSGDESPPTP